MKKRHAIMTGAAAAAVLLAGSLFASNMGFKLNKPLDSTGTNGSASGFNNVALPYNQQTNLVTAGDLRGDIGSGNVLSISRYVSATDSLATYVNSVANDFNLTPAESYLIQVSSDVNYIIVGSHDPGLVVNLDAPGTNGSQSGVNDFAPPYHTTASTAGELRAELNAALGLGSEDNTAILSISRYLPGTDGQETYAGSSATNFSLAPGEGYRIQVASDVAFVPAHF